VDGAFLEACVNVSKAPSWISGTRNPGKTLKAQVGACRAVALCQQVANILSKAGWSWLNESSECIKNSLNRTLQANRQITYDGLIETLHRALQNPEHGTTLAEKIRSRYKVALIDESQDTDARQLEIFKTFLGSPNRIAVLIGDPEAGDSTGSAS
jgi:superfamily I DNA/RNA helicase